MLEYNVLESGRLDDDDPGPGLITEVNEACADGWEPLGPVVIGNDSDGEEFYAQTLIRRID